MPLKHDDVIKWKLFPRYWPFVRGIHRSPMNSPHKGQWCEALMFSLICTRINGCVNNGEAGDLRRHWAHYDVIVMRWFEMSSHSLWCHSNVMAWRHQMALYSLVNIGSGNGLLLDGTRPLLTHWSYVSHALTHEYVLRAPVLENTGICQSILNLTDTSQKFIVSSQTPDKH